MNWPLSVAVRKNTLFWLIKKVKPRSFVWTSWFSYTLFSETISLFCDATMLGWFVEFFYGVAKSGKARSGRKWLERSTKESGSVRLSPSQKTSRLMLRWQLSQLNAKPHANYRSKTLLPQEWTSRLPLFHSLKRSLGCCGHSQQDRRCLYRDGIITPNTNKRRNLSSYQIQNKL